MMCDMFIFEQIHFLPRGLPRGYPLGRGRNHIQMEDRDWLPSINYHSNCLSQEDWSCKSKLSKFEQN